MAKFVHGERGQTVGERYRDIRIAVHRNNNHDLEAKMVDELLDQNDQNKYWRLVKNYRGIRDALDGLLPIKCLWPDMRLSTFHKIFSMKCDDVWLRRACWFYLLTMNSSL